MQLCELEIKTIRISGDNPRMINKKGEEFGELVSSIKSLGVKVPIHVRIDVKNKGKNINYELLAGERRLLAAAEAGLDTIPVINYELLAGERRLLAAAEAGLDTIPAINHGTISDEAAFEVTFAENFAREDLTVSDRMRLLTKAPREVGADGKAKPKPLKERRAMLEKKRWFVTIRNLIDKINENPVENLEVLTKLWEADLAKYLDGIRFYNKDRRKVKR